MDLEKYELRQDIYYGFEETGAGEKTATFSDGLVTHEYKYEEPKKKEIFVPCDCGNEIVRLTSWENEDEIYLSLYSFVGDNYSLWERIKILFCGKVRVGDVVLSSEEFNKIKEF